MRKRNLISGSALFALAVILFFQTRELTLWGELGPAEGFFPLVLSLLLASLSLLILVQTLLLPAEAKERFRITGPNRRKLFAYLGLFFGFGILFPIVGYTLILAAFLLTILRWVEKQGWKTALLVTSLLVISSHLLFVRLLGISIPEGVLASALRLWQ